ncbi:MAG: hypothetical protein ACRD3O_15875, partial [Terriglobia bacterium]
MNEVLANQNQIDKTREKYACLDTRELDTLGKHGNVKKKTTCVYQVSFPGGGEIQRLIEKNGKFLSAREQSKEDVRVRKQIAKIEKEAADEQSGKRKDRDAITVQDFIRADRFFNPRRERVAGRSLIAFDFERNPHFKPRTLYQKLAQALAGTVWIDPQAREVTSLEAHFSSNMKIYGGLLSVHRGSAVLVQQA